MAFIAPQAVLYSGIFTNKLKTDWEKFLLKSKTNACVNPVAFIRKPNFTSEDQIGIKGRHGPPTPHVRFQLLNNAGESLLKKHGQYQKKDAPQT